jgi:hypothetical protein
MKSEYRLLLLSLVIFCIFFFIETAFSNGNNIKLPRSFGPVYLGMTEKNFIHKFKIESDPCEGCVLDESIAGINLRNYPQLFPKDKYSQKGIDCMFYKGKLYKMILPADTTSIDSYRKKHALKYGAPTKEEHWPNGISWVYWDDGVTIHAVPYTNKRGNEYPFNVPKGTITHIEYIDKAMNNFVLRDEKQEKKQKGDNKRAP